MHLIAGRKRGQVFRLYSIWPRVQVPRLSSIWPTVQVPRLSWLGQGDRPFARKLISTLFRGSARQKAKLGRAFSSSVRHFELLNRSELLNKGTRNYYESTTVLRRLFADRKKLLHASIATSIERHQTVAGYAWCRSIISLDAVLVHVGSNVDHRNANGSLRPKRHNQNRKGRSRWLDASAKPRAEPKSVGVCRLRRKLGCQQCQWQHRPDKARPKGSEANTSTTSRETVETNDWPTLSSSHS